MPTLDLPPPAPGSPAAEPGYVPPLETGERLGHDEFWRRYEASPGVKAELIEGVVYVASPVRMEQHGEPHADLIGWLSVYRSQHPGVRLGVDSTVLMGGDNDPQPDATLMLPQERGGRARLVHGYIHGVPELVCEVSASSVALDTGPKPEAYLRAGGREYLIWRTVAGRIDWFAHAGDRYRRIEPGDDGVAASTVFDGLRLDTAAMLRGDLAAVLAAVSG